MNLDNAIVYDLESFVNCFTCSMEMLHSDTVATWEISPWRDDRAELLVWMDYLWRTQTPMIGFKSETYDYPMLHYLFRNPDATYAELRVKSDAIIKAKSDFEHIIWPRDRFAPQIDVYKIQHFDNIAKKTSLKALQVNMRSPTVVDSPLPFDQPVSRDDVDRYVIPYNRHDVKETKRFAHFIMPAIEFRTGLIPQFGVEVMCYNDTKIGEEKLKQRLGEDICFERVEYIGRDGEIRTRKQKRQTPRSRIALNDVIFPYIKFENPEFQRVLDYMRAQVLTPDDLEDENAEIKTKGVFSGLIANVGGVPFVFGTGGVHASVTKQRFQAGNGWRIRDIDVASLYPSIAIVNRLAPAHLGEAFVTEYAKLPAERKEWQKKKGKKCIEANTIKLEGNGAYGKTKSKYSFLYDPQYTMTVTINGQLMLSMLAERLVTVPTLQIIQVNTDGITYFIHDDYEPMAAAICKEWEAYTCLVLEDVDYNRMWIADVNTYLAEPVTEPGSNAPIAYKQKGRLWHPDPFNYAQSISECQPPAWHKDLGNVVSIKAAIAAMTQGIDPETFIRFHTDPFDFMLRVKVDKGTELWLGDRQVQSTTRYYIATDGQPFIKRMPPQGPLGQYKRANGITEADYARRMAETNGEHCPTVCTKNKSRYEIRDSYIEAGWKIRECNDASAFSFGNVNYDWYIAEARKLIVT